MARTPGAVDRRPRKRHNGSRSKSKSPATLPSSDNKSAASTPPSPEFFQEIEAAMGGPDKGHTLDEPGSQAPNGVTAVCGPAPVSPAPDEPPLTKEAWEGVLRVPFRMIAIAMQAPGVADVGNRRAKDLARPSYVIFEHYAREYLALNPDNPLSFAWVATALVAADISADVLVEIQHARADRRARAQPATLPGGEAVQSQAA